MKTCALALAILLIAAALAYGYNVGSGFILDDFGILSICRSKGILANNIKEVGQSYVRPVSWTVFGLIWSVWQSDPRPFHAVSILLLALTGLGIWGMWRQVFPASGPKTALAAGLLFVLWPAHGEVVCWVGGFPDLFAGLFAVTAIWCWLSFQRAPTILKAVAGALCVLLSIASKESALPLPVAIPLFCWLADRGCDSSDPRWWFRPKTWVVLVAPGIAVVMFWMLRAHLIGHLVGGYGAKTPFDGGLIHLLGTRGMVETANMFLPLVRLAPLVGADVAGTWMTILIAVVMLLLARTWPRAKAASGRLVRLLPVVLLVQIWIWAGLAFLDLWGFAELMRFNIGPSYTGLVIASPFVVLLGVRRMLTESRLEAFEGRKTLGILAMAIAWGFLYERISTSLELVGIWVILLAFVYLTRPVQPGFGPSGILSAFWLSMITLSIGSVFLVINLPVGWDGQQERFSYFGSIFAVLGLAALLEGTLRGTSRKWVWGAVLAATFALVSLANLRWYRVGRISNQMAEIVRRSPQGAQIFVLVAPGVLDGAGLLQIGIPEMAYALTGRQDVAAGLGLTVDTFNSGDGIKVTKLAEDDYEIDLTSVPDKLHPSRLVATNSAMFDSSGRTLRLLNRREGDLVVVIDGDGPRLVD